MIGLTKSIKLLEYGKMLLSRNPWDPKLSKVLTCDEISVFSNLIQKKNKCESLGGKICENPNVQQIVDNLDDLFRLLCF